MTETQKTATSAMPALRRNRRFLWLWGGQSISQIGTQITTLAVPLIAVINLHGSGLQVTSLRSVEYLPSLLFGLVAGVWIDRLDGRMLMIASDLCRCAILTAVPVLAWLHQLNFAVLYAAVFTVGVFTVAYDLSYQSLLPNIVRGEDLIDANGWLQASSSAATGVGPLVGGTLAQAFTAPTAVMFDAISYIPSALSTFFMGSTHARFSATRKSFRAELIEGIQALIRDSVQLRLTATALTSNFFGAAIQSLLVIYAVNSLHLSPLAIGIAFAGNAIGAGLAAVILPWLARHMSAHLCVMTGLIVDAAGYLGVVFAGRASRPVDTAVLATASLLGTAGMVIVGTRAMAWRQQVTPPEILGRVIGATRSLAFGLLPLGALAAGFLADISGTRIALIVCACGMLSACLWLVTIRESTHNRNHE